MTFSKCKLSVIVLLCFSALHSVYERAWYTLGQMSKWICTSISSEIGMKPEEALTTDGISTPLHAIQIVWWTLHKNRRTQGSYTRTHIQRRLGGRHLWPRRIRSCCFVGSYRARRVKMPHSWRRAENGLEVEATGWKQEAQAISVRNTQKQRWSVLFAPRTKSERQRPSRYFRICGSRHCGRQTWHSQ